MELREEKNVLGSRWHFTVKFEPNAKPCRRNARLVAKGFSLREEIDYKKTYSPTARLETFRVVKSIAAQNSWSSKQLDTKIGYLNDNVDADIFIKQPDCFEEKRPNGKKIKL